VREASFECPILRREEAHLDPPAEVTLEVREFDRTVKRRFTRFTLAVPFIGDPAFFAMQATTFFDPGIPGELDERTRHLRLFRDGSSKVDGAAIKQNFEHQLDQVEKCLSWTQNDIRNHNSTIATKIREWVAQRRAKLLADRQLQASIGYPINRRADADVYSVPIVRKRITPMRSPGQPTAPHKPFAPEPILADADYEAALDVLRNSRNALERSPSTTAKLNEEEIRNILLVSLNAVFEGQAAGEVFNGAGKTDILIRVNDRNVFIGECKIWHGPSTIAEALDQLLGYLVWRDTKAALLLFIRNKDVAAAISKATTEIEQHANFKRRGAHDTEERIDFVLHAANDHDREIRLALLPFALSFDPPNSHPAERRG
jgi:hypothetical protein